MRCPWCYHTLYVVDQRPLETLLEHVSDPNGTPALKDAYGCLNRKCAYYYFASSYEWFRTCWDEFGDVYSKICRNEAIFSFSWKYNTYQKHINRMFVYPWARLMHKLGKAFKL